MISLNSKNSFYSGNIFFVKLFKIKSISQKKENKGKR